jgi:hypothetical protein
MVGFRVLIMRAVFDIKKKSTKYCVLAIVYGKLWRLTNLNKYKRRSL